MPSDNMKPISKTAVPRKARGQYSWDRTAGHRLEICCPMTSILKYVLTDMPLQARQCLGCNYQVWGAQGSQRNLINTPTDLIDAQLHC